MRTAYKISVGKLQWEIKLWRLIIGRNLVALGEIGLKVWTGSFGSGWGSVSCFCENGENALGSIEIRPDEYPLLKNDPVP
jgi:hypothetical protein